MKLHVMERGVWVSGKKLKRVMLSMFCPKLNVREEGVITNQLTEGGGVE